MIKLQLGKRKGTKIKKQKQNKEEIERGGRGQKKETEIEKEKWNKGKS